MLSQAVKPYLLLQFADQTFAQCYAQAPTPCKAWLMPTATNGADWPATVGTSRGFVNYQHKLEQRERQVSTSGA